MNYDPFKKRTNGKALLRELEKQETNRVKGKAQQVDREIETAKDQLKSAKRAEKLARKRVKQMKKALKKFAKTGNAKHLEAFNVVSF